MPVQKFEIALKYIFLLVDSSSDGCVSLPSHPLGSSRLMGYVVKKTPRTVSL